MTAALAALGTTTDAGASPDGGSTGPVGPQAAPWLAQHVLVVGDGVVGPLPVAVAAVRTSPRPPDPPPIIEPPEVRRPEAGTVMAYGSPAPVLSFGWRRCLADVCVELPGTASTHPLVPGEDPTGLELRVTAANDLGRADQVITSTGQRAYAGPPPQGDPPPQGELGGGGPPITSAGADGFTSADGRVRCVRRGSPKARSLHCSVTGVRRGVRLSRREVRRLPGPVTAATTPGVLAPGRTWTLGAITCKAVNHGVVVCRNPSRRVVLAAGRVENAKRRR